MEFIEVAGAEALNELAIRIDAAKSGGPWPVILGGEESLEVIKEALEPNSQHYGSAQAVLEAADKLDVAGWFAAARLANEDIYPVLESEIAPSEVHPAPGISTHLNPFKDKPLKRVFLALIDVDRPADVFAHLFWGGWNECPDAPTQVALHRQWEGRWGAQVVSVTENIVQCQVARPPQSMAEAMSLAEEQFLYCTDIVVQGTETIENLAASLVHAKAWYFWWD